MTRREHYKTIAGCGLDSRDGPEGLALVQGRSMMSKWIYLVLVAHLLAGVATAEIPLDGTADNSTGSIGGITPDQTNSLAGLEPFVDRLVGTAMEDHALPGVTVSVVKDDRIILLKGYGHADLEEGRKVDPEKSLFRIGSITKTMTSLAIMQLVEQGKLELDRDVNDYLDDIQIPDTFQEPITIKALLSHRSGFEDSVLGHLFVRDKDRLMAKPEYLAKYMPARVRAPGVVSSYSNYGFALLGHIVETQSGKDYALYLEENLFQPLGMMHTTIREPLGKDNPLRISDEHASHMARGYTKGRDGEPSPQPFDHLHHVESAGAISASAKDMALYMIARLADDAYKGGHLVSPETTVRMKERLYHDRPFAPDLAHGMIDRRRRGFKERSHTGGTAYFFSHMALFPELNLGVFMSTNSTDGGTELMNSFPDRILKEFFAPEMPNLPSPSSDFAKRGKIYEGKWMGTRRSYTGLEKILVLGGFSGGVATTRVDQEGYLVLNFGGEIIKSVEIGDGAFHGRVDEEDVIFQILNDETGQPGLITLLANDLERINFMESPQFFLIAFAAALFFAITTLLGALIRKLRKRRATWVGKLAATTSLIFMVVLAALVAVVVGTGNQIDVMFDFPTPAMKLLLGLILVYVAAGALTLLASPLAFVGKDRGTLRKVHYFLFVFSSMSLVYALFHWNMIGFKFP